MNATLTTRGVGVPTVMRSAMALLHEWSERWDPVAPALSWEGITLTYGDLDRRARCAAGWLRERGVRAGDVVALMLPRGLGFVELCLACLGLGAVGWPLNERYPVPEARALLEAGRPALAIVPREVVTGWPEAPPSVEPVLAEAEIAGGAAPPWGPAPSRGASALLLYTSGTTGRPKGVIHSHETLKATVDALHGAFRWSSSDVLLHTLPQFHVHGLVVAQYGALRAGALAHWVPRFEAPAVLRALADGPATVLMGVPTHYARLLAEPDTPDLFRMRLFTSGSAPLPPRTFEAFRDRFGHAILERYGMTEVGIVLANPYDDRRAGSAGRPLPDVEVRVEHGELQIRAPSRFVGYRGGRAAPPREAFFPSGDLGDIDADGFVYLRGRRADLILCGGFNVYPAEVEAILAEHPGVRECAVVGRPHADLGEVPVAFWVGDGDPSALEAWLRSRVAAYKVPRRFHQVASLPRNAMGKVSRMDLRQQLVDPGEEGDARGRP